MKKFYIKGGKKKFTMIPEVEYIEEKQKAKKSHEALAGAMIMFAVLSVMIACWKYIIWG